MSDFVRELTGGSPEVAVIGASRGPAGQLIRRMFLEAKRSLHMITDDFEAAAGGSSDDTGMQFNQCFQFFMIFKARSRSSPSTKLKRL